MTKVRNSDNKGLSEAEQRHWWIFFFGAWGKRKPEAVILDRPYTVSAPNRVAALDVLRKADLRSHCDGWLSLWAGEEVRICEFDLSQCMVTGFDASGLDPDGYHYYAAVIEHGMDEELRPGWHDEAHATRYRATERLGASYRAGVPTSAGKIDDLPALLRNSLKIVRGGCWRWIGNTYPKTKITRMMISVNVVGYGIVSYEGRRWQAHRLVFTLLRSEAPKGALLRHLCHFQDCCNPLHLELGTHLENARDRANKKLARRVLREAGILPEERLSRLRHLADV